MWVAIMGVIVIYIYALIGFAFFRASFDTDESRFCRTLAECFVTVLRYGAVGELTEVITIFCLIIFTVVCWFCIWIWMWRLQPILTTGNQIIFSYIFQYSCKFCLTTELRIASSGEHIHSVQLHVHLPTDLLYSVHDHWSQRHLRYHCWYIFRVKRSEGKYPLFNWKSIEMLFHQLWKFFNIYFLFKRYLIRWILPNIFQKSQISQGFIAININSKHP